MLDLLFVFLMATSADTAGFGNGSPAFPACTYPMSADPGACDLQYNDLEHPFHINERYKCTTIDCAECKMDAQLTGQTSPKFVVTCLCNGGTPTGNRCVSYVYFDYNSIFGSSVVSITCVSYNCTPPVCSDSYPSGPNSGDPVCHCQ